MDDDSKFTLVVNVTGDITNNDLHSRVQTESLIELTAPEIKRAVSKCHDITHRYGQPVKIKLLKLTGKFGIKEYQIIYERDGDEFREEFSASEYYDL